MTTSGAGVKKTLREKLLSLFRLIIIAGISYVILAPVVGLVTSSFFSNADAYSPMVFTIPMAPTLDRYARAIVHLKYLPTLGRTLLVLRLADADSADGLFHGGLRVRAIQVSAEKGAVWLRGDHDRYPRPTPLCCRCMSPSATLIRWASYR